VFIEAKDGGSGGDNWSYNRAKFQSNHHHQKTNTNSFFTGRMPFLVPNQQCQSTEGIPWTCLPQAHLGSSNFVFAN